MTVILLSEQVATLFIKQSGSDTIKKLTDKFNQNDDGRNNKGKTNYLITIIMEEQRSDKIYGGCEGPDAMYVKLISSDGHEFIVKREHALTSGTIKAMLSGPGQFAENEANEVHFREIPVFCLVRQVVRRLSRRLVQTLWQIPSTPSLVVLVQLFPRWMTTEVALQVHLISHILQKVCIYFTYKVRYTNSSTEIPEFPIAPEIALELLMAANFLDC